MTVLVSSRAIAVTIGNQDWSAWVGSFLTGYTEVDDGAVETSAKLTLFLPATFDVLPSDPRYLLNKKQWHRGVRVRVQVSNSAGVLVDHPCGYLYLLSVPPQPEINSEWVLDLGCAIALNSFRQADGNAAGVSVGKRSSRDRVVSTLLDFAGVPASISSIPYPFDYPLPKVGGSYVQQAGQIARAANYSIYCDRRGIAREFEIEFDGAELFDTFTIGVDEALWEPSNGGEIPVGELQIMGTTFALIDPFDTTVEDVLGRKKDVDATLLRPESEDSTIVSRTTISDAPYNALSRTQTKTTTIEKPAQLVVADIEPNKFLFKPYSIDEIVSSYDTDGRLISTVQTLSVTKRAIFPNELIYPFDLTATTRTTVTYEYQKNGLVSAISTLTEEPIYKIDNTQTSEPYVLENKTLNVQFWEEIKPGKWAYKISNYAARFIVEGALVGRSAGYGNYDLILNLSAENKTTTGRDSSLYPPSAQYRQPAKSQIETPLLATVLSKVALLDDQLSPRSRPITVEYATNKEQLIAYGEVFDRLLYGRRFGWRIGFAISDKWLSNSVRPLLRVDAIWQGQTYRLLVDGLTYLHSFNAAYIVGNGILIGIA